MRNLGIEVLCNCVKSSFVCWRWTSEPKMFFLFCCWFNNSVKKLHSLTPQDLYHWRIMRNLGIEVLCNCVKSSFVCWLWTLEPKSLFLLFGWKFLRHTPVGNRGVTMNKTNKIKVLPKSLSVLLCPGMPISQSHHPDCQILSKKNWKGKGEAIFDTLFMIQNRTANQANFHPNWSGLAELSTVVCIKDGKASFLRFWKNHP